MYILRRRVEFLVTIIKYRDKKINVVPFNVVNEHFLDDQMFLLFIIKRLRYSVIKFVR